MSDTNKSKVDYDNRQKEKGLTKSCYWHSPDDKKHMSNQARLSRKRHERKIK